MNHLQILAQHLCTYTALHRSKLQEVRSHRVLDHKRRYAIGQSRRAAAWELHRRGGHRIQRNIARCRSRYIIKLIIRRHRDRLRIPGRPACRNRYIQTRYRPGSCHHRESNAVIRCRSKLGHNHIGHRQSRRIQPQRRTTIAAGYRQTILGHPRRVIKPAIPG